MFIWDRNYLGHRDLACQQARSRYPESLSWEILVLGLLHPPMTTPNSTISESYKHLTTAKAYIARQIAPWRKRHIWVWSVSDVSSRIRVRAALPC